MGIRYTLRKATQSLRFSSVVPAYGNDWTTVFMIHKRELSDSMIESGSSLFYCVPRHQRNPDRVFRSAGISLCFFFSIHWVVSASRLILLKGLISADIRPAAHVALPIIIPACRDDRPVRFQSDRVITACRDGHDIRPVAHVALPLIINACRDDPPVRFQSDRVKIVCRDGHDIRPVAHVAFPIHIIAYRDDRPVRFQSDRVKTACRNSDDIPPAAHVALAILIVARRDDRSVRFQAYSPSARSADAAAYSFSNRAALSAQSLYSPKSVYSA